MSWIQTFTGRRFDPVRPEVSEIDILDIAHSLSNLCRFNGHSRRFYSVAEHSVIVSFHVPRSLALAGLLHDAAEAYTSDLVRPLKLWVRSHTETFDAVERRVEKAVAERFDLPWPLPTEIEDIDNRLLAAERDQVFATDCASEWDPLPEPLDETIEFWLPCDARDAFLDRFRELASLDEMVTDEPPGEPRQEDV